MSRCILELARTQFPCKILSGGGGRIRLRLNHPPSRTICLATASRPSLLGEHAPAFESERAPSSRRAPLSRKMKQRHSAVILRRREDSNLRGDYSPNSLARSRIRPLCHASLNAVIGNLLTLPERRVQGKPRCTENVFSCVLLFARVCCIAHVRSSPYCGHHGAC